MTRRRSYEFDDFRINQRPNGEWVVEIRTSPEDMSEYDLEEGVRRMFKKLSRWQDTIAEDHAAAHELEMGAQELQARINEAIETFQPLVDAGILDDLGVGEMLAAYYGDGGGGRDFFTHEPGL